MTQWHVRKLNFCIIVKSYMKWKTHACTVIRCCLSVCSSSWISMCCWPVLWMPSLAQFWFYYNSVSGGKCRSMCMCVGVLHQYTQHEHPLIHIRSAVQIAQRGIKWQPFLCGYNMFSPQASCKHASILWNNVICIGPKLKFMHFVDIMQLVYPTMHIIPPLIISYWQSVAVASL